MKNIFAHIPSSRALRETAITYGGLVLGGASLFLLNVLMGRWLDPAQYGGFSIALVALNTLAELSDFGLNAALIRFASYYSAHGETGKLHLLMKMVWIWRVRLAAILTVSGIAFSRLIAQHVFNAPELGQLLALSFLGIGGVIFLGFVTTYLQATRHYTRAACLQISKGLLRLALVGGFYMAGFSSLRPAMVLYAAVPWILFTASARFLPRGFLAADVRDADAVAIRRQLGHFSFWIALWSFAAVVSGRVEQVFVSGLMGLSAVATYSVAYQFIQFYSVGVQAISAVTGPRIGAVRTRAELAVVSRRAFRWLSALVVLLIPFVFVSARLIPIFFGTKYAGAMPVYIVLSLGYLFYFLATPFSFVISAYNRTYLYAVCAVIQFGITVALNYLLIPRMGIQGASAAFAIGSLYMFAFNAVSAAWLVRYREFSVS